MDDALNLVIEDTEDCRKWDETADTIHGKPLHLFPFLLYEVREEVMMMMMALYILSSSFYICHTHLRLND